MESKYHKTFLTIIFILFIVFIGLFLKQPIFIENLLTHAPDHDFTIHISTWRIIFEPFLGFPLFFLRGNEPVAEFFIFFVWSILAALVWPFFIRRIRVQEPQWVKKFLKTGLRDILIIFSIFWAILIALIFLPLPTNTIVKKNADCILANFHSHSHLSHDGLISARQLMKWHRRNGFEAFFLTEHNHHLLTLEWVEKQRSGRIESQPLLLAGQEYSGSNHILLLGLTRDFGTKDMPDSVAIDSALAQNGVAIIPHWFVPHRNTRSVRYYIDCGATGFEIANQGEGVFYDQVLIAEILAHRDSVLLVGNCDYHGYGSASSIWNALHIPGWSLLSQSDKEQAVMDILRKRDQARLRVLAYRDRSLYARLWLSPIYNVIAYFRGLEWSQLISWIFWLMLIQYLVTGRLCIKVRDVFLKNYLRIRAVVGILAAGFSLYFGVLLLVKSFPLKEYNHILLEFGVWQSAVGSILLILNLLSYRYKK